MTTATKILVGVGIISTIILFFNTSSDQDSIIISNTIQNAQQHKEIYTLPTLIPTQTTTQPIVPAKVEQNCHSGYEGACLDPNASDYDCIGGSGNGPYYTGRVRVVGPDVFGLDRDHDGIGCE